MATIWPHLVVCSSLGAAEKWPHFSVPGFIKKSTQKTKKKVPDGANAGPLRGLIRGNVQPLTNLGTQRDHVMRRVMSCNCLLPNYQIWSHTDGRG